MMATKAAPLHDPVTPLLAAAFFCELAMLAGWAVVGGTLVTGVIAPIALAIACPLAVAVLWGMLLAPKARRRLPGVPRVALKVALFVGTGVALIAVGYLVTGIALAVITGVCVIAVEVRSDPTL